MWKRGTRSPFFQFSNTQRCPFRRLLALLGSSPSSLTAGNRVGSGRLGRGSPWLDARTGRGKCSLLGFAAFPELSSRHQGAACASERVLREGRREAGESFWREAGE